MSDGLERMIDDIFKLPPVASVIIDQVPPNEGDVKEMIHDFREKISEHAKLDGREIEFATVLAFGPPKALSERIHHRNASADISKVVIIKYIIIFWRFWYNCMRFGDQYFNAALH